ncbi:MAG: hypothetical protein HWE11_01455, partial [Gammaproteobacteria bacterium]|nr:hypothetical protein [Gammaproteobacteria bacterium]
QSLKQVPAMQVEWVTPDYFPIQAPAFPTLVVMSEGELVYFGAVGSGPMCINAGLENFLIQQNSQSRKQFWLNTVVKGCFCHR